MTDPAAPPGAHLEVPPAARDLGERFRAAGHELYLVGGIVRDLLIGRSIDGKELDFATSASPPETTKLLKAWGEHVYLVGVAYGTVSARRGEAHVEVTTFREEVYAAEHRKPTVTFGKDITTDLSRRDFTVNAMAISVPDGAFVDPFGGVKHLAAKILDTPLEPDVAFGDDPLRMLRAARFASSLEAAPSPRVVEALGRMASRLDIVSAERIADELGKLLQTAKPSLGLRLLVETGIADRFLPELPALRLEQDPVHKHKDVLEHTFAVVENCDRADLVLRLAALFHDIGKPKTRVITPEGVQFHHHEVVGARMTKERMTALRFANATIDAVTALVELHLRFHGYGEGWTDAAVRRYVRDAGPLLDRLNQLTRADVTTGNKFKAKQFQSLQDDLEERIARLAEQEALDAMRPPLDGTEVMAHLGLPPGPIVGEALDHLMELRLDEGLVDRDAAIAALDAWAAAKGLARKR
ncbi:MAG: CCA tRNA nucleotidyltransferase [Actinomycetota bacterium]